MIDLLLCIVLAAIAGGIIAYLVHEKKKGVTCVGCPYAKECAKKRNGTCASHNVHSRETTHTAKATSATPAKQL